MSTSVVSKRTFSFSAPLLKVNQTTLRLKKSLILFLRKTLPKSCRDRFYCSVIYLSRVEYNYLAAISHQKRFRFLVERLCQEERSLKDEEAYFRNGNKETLSSLFMSDSKTKASILSDRNISEIHRHKRLETTKAIWLSIFVFVLAAVGSHKWLVYQTEASVGLSFDQKLKFFIERRQLTLSNFCDFHTTIKCSKPQC